MKTQVDEQVHLSDPDPAWPGAFNSERARLQSLLNLPVEHIGSTAVAGLPAKPIVDMQLGVPVYPAPPETVTAIESLGYENLGESGVPGRLYFRLRSPSPFNLHVVQFGGDHWSNNIAIRDYLRHSEAARREYTQAKYSALAHGSNGLLSYSAAKADVVASLLSRARALHHVG